MTEDLQVQPEDLDRFATAMSNLAADSDSAKQYVAKWFDISGDDARIFAHVAGIAEQVRQNLEANYDKLRQLAEASATEITKSAEMYRTTDLATAKRLDSTYGEGQ
ncbi:hypothetical protein IU510_21480 [Nocardia cyriacigeorgica]|uniref:type VII secretion target n=1 Tax=Nocardia cyriacigeorgica TaxID=135487 RepID=UPI0018951A83|nr:type VII secretion target [Nocardia cyriacigeorgica]MBF6100631.1 hypothetical protein [Nocardia cyriacigeorgica]